MIIMVDKNSERYFATLHIYIYHFIFEIYGSKNH